MPKQNFSQLIINSIKEHWELPALSNYNGKHLNYSDVALEIKLIHELFKQRKIKKQDKIAVIGKNSVNWAITYLATITYGAVIVPILPDFKPEDIHHIVNHSDAKLLFCDDKIYDLIEETDMSNLKMIISLNSKDCLFGRKKHYVQEYTEMKDQLFRENFKNFTKDNLIFPKIDNSEMAALVYTSGTTGFSKGVMLSHNSLASNVVYAIKNMPLKREDSILSFMPLAHAYGCSFEFLFPFCLGCHITFLSKIPSPKIILKAFSEIKPQLILSVPLVIEKIYKKQIKPMISKPHFKFLLNSPFKNIIYKVIREKLFASFGGNFLEIVIGGAPLNKEVEKFFKAIKFPFSVGYGMTECGPLICYAGWREHKIESVGRVVDRLEIKIDSSNPEREVGEILVRGENVMLGYYKNDEITKETITKDGWLHTGDLGIIDKEGFVYIKGRSKSMILGPSGQNIYPEEIQAKLDNMMYVQESLVIERDGQIIALVYPDFELADSHNKGLSDLEKEMEKNRKQLNKQLPSYSSIKKIELYPEEFEKTPTKKIKRFLYTSH